MASSSIARTLEAAAGTSSRISECPTCGGSARLAFRLSDRGVYACTDPGCALRFAAPQPPDTTLARYYQQCYYGEGTPVYENSPEPYLGQLLLALDRRIGGLPGKRVLDFGCGIGTLLRLLAAAGAGAVDGVESDAQARASVRDLLGIDVAGDVSELKQRAVGPGYDLITMIDVIEHVRDPSQSLVELRGLLRPGGWLLVSTPDVGSAKARLLGQRWDNYQNPTHLFYFSGRSLGRLIRSAGFAEVTVWRPLLSYPAHSTARRLLQMILQRLGLDGALHILARVHA